MTLTMLELIDELIRNRVDEEMARLNLNGMDYCACRLASEATLQKIQSITRSKRDEP